jgi:hypothetical protein
LLDGAEEGAADFRVGNAGEIVAEGFGTHVFEFAAGSEVEGEAG